MRYTSTWAWQQKKDEELEQMREQIDIALIHQKLNEEDTINPK